MRSAASSGDISSSTSAARSESRWPKISTWSSSGQLLEHVGEPLVVHRGDHRGTPLDGQVVQHVRGVGGLHLRELGDQQGGALGLLAPGQPVDLAPLDDVGLAAAAELAARLLHGHPRHHPVAVARLLHRDVVDGAGDAGGRDGDRAVEHLADHEGLGRPLLEAAHVEQPGRVDLPAVDVGHAGHRDEDPAPAEHLRDQPEHPRLVDLRAHRDHQVTDLADLVPLGVEDRQADQPGGVHACRGGAHGANLLRSRTVPGHHRGASAGRSRAPYDVPVPGSRKRVEPRHVDADKLRISVPTGPFAVGALVLAVVLAVAGVAFASSGLVSGARGSSAVAGQRRPSRGHRSGRRRRRPSRRSSGWWPRRASSPLPRRNRSRTPTGPAGRRSPSGPSGRPRRPSPTSVSR